MKLTWFGGTTVRVHIGGVILVVDPDGAPANIDRAELLSGADRVIKVGGLRSVDFSNWRPRKVGRLLDETEEAPVDAWSNEAGAILIEALGEAPLLLVSQSVPPLGRWAESAVVMLFGSGGQLVDLGRAVLAQRPPRLLALAGNDAAIDDAVPHLRDHLDGAGLVALEAGMALEV